MLGAFGIAIVLSVELALLEPWLANLVARRVADDSIAGAPIPLLAMTLAFGLTILGVLAASARVAGAFRIPDAWRAVPERLSVAYGREPAFRQAADAAAVPAADRTRAVAVADSIISTQRREAAVAAATTRVFSGTPAPVAPSRTSDAASLSRDVPGPAAPPLGQSLGRRTRNRVSASAGRRDGRR
jgi:type IV secretion system protein VirB6